MQVNNLREAIDSIVREVFRSPFAALENEPFVWVIKATSVIVGIAGFLVTIFKFDRGFKDAVLYGTHCFLYLPVGIAALWMFAGSFVTFNAIWKGLYNQLVDRWIENYRRKHPNLLSLTVPYYRFMIPAVLLAAVCALVPLLLMGLMLAVVSAFAPYGMPSLFDGASG